MHRQMMLAVYLVCAALAPARAELTGSDLAGVEASPRLGAVLPLSVRLRDENGVARPIREWLTGEPGVWVLADFTCDTLCGPVVSTVSDALRQSGLRPGQDFDLHVVSFDPQDTPENAKDMKQAQVGLEALGDAAHVSRGDAGDIAALTRAFGFEAVYDRDHGRYAHPAAAFVVTADGRIARVLPGLGLHPASLRLALVEAGQGRKHGGPHDRHTRRSGTFEEAKAQRPGESTEADHCLTRHDRRRQIGDRLRPARGDSASERARFRDRISTS
ncbi:protein SCO1/2 [Bradyrhizobium sp. USDA 4504]